MDSIRPLILLGSASKGSKLKCIDLQFISRGKKEANFRLQLSLLTAVMKGKDKTVSWCSVFQRQEQLNIRAKNKGSQ